jgi:colanic acid biosynthesis glycosyl transferase WcaI
VNVLILNQSFYPDVASVAQHAADLASALAAEGHSVTVVASRHGYEDPATVYPARETWRGCDIRRVRSAALGRSSASRRALDAVVLLLAFVWKLIWLPRFDVTIAMTQPPLLSVLAVFATGLKGGRVVSWVMDLNPDEAIAAGWFRSGSAIARVLSRALVFSLRASARVVVLDRFMRARIEGKGVDAAGIEVIAPWSHDHHVRYDAAGRDAFRRSHGLAGKFVVMYAGNVSLVHPIATLLEAADRLRGREDIVFCFVGGGVGRREVEAFAASRRLPNVVLLPYQPLETLAAVLSAADLHAVVMGETMAGIVHPCKIYNVMAAGSPFLYIGPPVSHIVEVCAGLRTPGAAYYTTHGDPAAAASAIVEAAARGLRDVPELIEAARAFSQDALVPRFTAVVSTCDVAPAQEAISNLYEFPQPDDSRLWRRRLYRQPSRKAPQARRLLGPRRRPESA